MRPARAPHLISRDGVDAWLAGSAVPGPTFHRTTAAAARAIVERGVSIARSRVGAYGQGFYTATEPDPVYGEADVIVAVRLLHPLRGDDARVGEVIDAIAAQYVAKLNVRGARDCPSPPAHSRLHWSLSFPHAGEGESTSLLHPSPSAWWCTQVGALGGRLTPLVASRVRRELLRLGYDGIIVLDGGGDGVDYVIALDARSVKVVQP